MDIQSTQVLERETAIDDNDNDTQIGTLHVGSTEHPIVKGFTKIGRSPALCKIVLDDLTVSKVHAEIQAGRETAFISDVRSANGTRIQDVPLKPFYYYSINDGDAIYLGTVKAIFTTNKLSEEDVAIVPETPLASRNLGDRNTPGPANTSDCLFNNSSIYQSDESVVPGTQRKEKKAPIFQEPPVPTVRQKGGSRSSTSVFAPSVSTNPGKNGKTTTSEDAASVEDLHDLETQQIDTDSLLPQSRAPSKSRTEKIEQDIVDPNFYEAETQELPLRTEIKERADNESAKKTRLNDTTESCSRGNNSSVIFSRELQMSSSVSPPESPNLVDESAEIAQSQDLLELCETPLLEYARRANGAEEAAKSNQRQSTIEDDDIAPGETSKASPSATALDESVDRRKSVQSSHVIAESDDESVTDDDMDLDIVEARLNGQKVGMPGSRASDVIDDDSTTDDEGKFKSIASNSSSKGKEMSMTEIRRETAEDRDLFEAETQQMEQKPTDFDGAKNCREMAKNREAVSNIFEAETQRITNQEPPEFASPKTRRETAKDRDTVPNIFDAETQREEQEPPAFASPKKRRETAKHREAVPSIFAAETQRTDLEPPAVGRAQKRREKAKDRDSEANIFDAATQRMDLEPPAVGGAQKRREKAKDRDSEVNIFDAATQRMDEETAVFASPMRRRETVKNRDVPTNIFEAETQQMDQESPDLAGVQKRRGQAKDADAENIFEAATQKMDPASSDAVEAKKRRDALTRIQDDTDIDLLPTQVLDVPTSTPVLSRSRKWSLRRSEKSPRAATEEDLHLAATQIMTDGDDLAADTSPSLENENKGEKKDNRPHKGKNEKSPRLETEENLPLAQAQIVSNGDDVSARSAREDSTVADSSSGGENASEEKDNRAVNLDETLMRNLGKILDQEANNQEVEEDSTQLLTQNLVDILRPTQGGDDEIDDDVREPRSPKRKKISSPGTLGFIDGLAVSGNRWSRTVPAAASTMREDGNEDQEKTELAGKEPQLSECLDDDDILFGLPEVRISGTLSNPGSPTPSTTSSHGDFVMPSMREAKNVKKGKGRIAASSTENASSLNAIEATKSPELSSPVVPRRGRLARRKLPRKIIEDEDQDSDEVFGYNDLKKMADSLLASDSVDSARSREKNNDGVVDDPEKLSSTGRALRHVRKAIPSKNDAADSSRRTRKLPQPPSSLLVSDVKSKRTANDESTSTDTESSSAGASRISSRLPKAAKSAASKPKVTSKQGKESQEVEAILAATPEETVPAIARKSYAKVQLTRVDDDGGRQDSNDAADNFESPRVNRKRRNTMFAKDLTLAPASPASTKTRRTIAATLDNRVLPKVEHKILITGLKEDYSKLVKKLGGSVVSEPSKATVLITDKVRRTYKFLCAVSQGLRVVSINWLLESKKVDRFLDCDDFILKDPAAEKQYRFKLERSLLNARNKKFLEGYTIVVTPKVNQPDVHELKAMVETSGGRVLTRAPGVRAWNSKTVIVSREEDLTAINVLLSKCPKSLKITVQSTEFILTGILRQEVNLDEHKLDIP